VKQRKFSIEEKMAVVMAMLKGQRPVVQICKEHAISDSLAYRWRDEALEAMKSGFTDKRPLRHDTSNVEKERLLKIIGQQAVVIEFQKKISEGISL
jgi:transposase-like protein